MQRRLGDDRGAPRYASSATPREIEDYSGGFCHIFALAILKYHEWRMYGIGDLRAEHSLMPWQDLGGVPRHIHCLNQWDPPVDVNGVFESEAHILRYCAHQHAPNEELISTPVGKAELVELVELANRSYRTVTDSELKQTYDVVTRLQLQTLAPILLMIKFSY